MASEQQNPIKDANQDRSGDISRTAEKSGEVVRRGAKDSHAAGSGSSTGDPGNARAQEHGPAAGTKG